jgi:hypothetical protein
MRLLPSWHNDLAERERMDKPRKSQARPLADIARKTFADAFAKQGFASTELVTRWPEIVGLEIAAHSEPEKILWPRPVHHDAAEPGTLVLRVEGPTAVEIQHLSRVILERVNRFFGWQAVTDLRLRQAPLSRAFERKRSPRPDGEAAARLAADLPEIVDESLRAALGRLGVALRGAAKE